MPAERSESLEYGACIRPPDTVRPGAIDRRLQVPSVLWCGLVITWIKLLLRVRGFRWTLAWIRRRVEGLPCAASADLEQLRAIEYAVAMAGALYPGRARCLEQSLTLYYTLRRQGVAVKYCQGVQPYPFLAHAWVEHGGIPINDFPEHTKQFVAFPDL